MNRTTATVLSLSLSLLGGLAAAPAAAQSSCTKYRVVNPQWGPPVKESAGIQFECPGDGAITGMEHLGDENGNTRYQCGSLGPGTVQPVSCAWSTEVKESQGYFTCTDNKVLTGRKHSGDENGKTTYECCTMQLTTSTGSLALTLDSKTCSWSSPQKQSDTAYVCPDNGVMVARDHTGDENGSTRYYCCGLQSGTCR